MKLLMSLLPPGRRVEVEHEVVLLARVEAEVGELLGLLVPLPGSGCRRAGRWSSAPRPPPRRACLSALSVISALRGRNDTQSAAADAVGRRRRLHHDVVEVERDLGHRHAVVGHRQRCARCSYWSMCTSGSPSVSREVVDDRLDRVVELVELPRLDLADVAVRIDDACLSWRGTQLLPERSGARLARARLPFLAGVEGLRLGTAAAGRAATSPVSGSSWTTSSVNAGIMVSSVSRADA